jgi:hypothetical protein
MSINDKRSVIEDKFFESESLLLIFLASSLSGWACCRLIPVIGGQ